MDISKRIGIKIRALRKQEGLSQAELAELIDRSTEAVSNLERGVSSPNLETLYRLSNKLSIPISHFIDDISDVGYNWKREELLSELHAISRSLTDKELEIAVNQLKAFT